MRLPVFLLLTTLGTSGLTACAANEPESDGVDDSFLGDGKIDTGNISEGSSEARGVLRVANEATLAVLEDEGIAHRAADNIVGYRRGDDNVAGTADDETFDTLAELDAVPYVGPFAFQHLLELARDLAYVSGSPFEPDACAGTPMLVNELAIRKGALSPRTIATYQVHQRERHCATGGSCTPWSQETAVSGDDYRGEVVLGPDHLDLVRPGCSSWSGIPYHVRFVVDSPGVNMIRQTYYFQTHENDDGTCNGGLGYERLASGSYAVNANCTRLQWTITANYGSYRIETQRATLIEY